MYTLLSLQLNDLVALVRGKLKKMERAIMSALIVIEVHARDVVHKMVEEGVKNINDFEWISQLRYAGGRRRRPERRKELWEGRVKELVYYTLTAYKSGKRRPWKMGVEWREWRDSVEMCVGSRLQQASYAEGRSGGEIGNFAIHFLSGFSNCTNTVGTIGRMSSSFELSMPSLCTVMSTLATLVVLSSRPSLIAATSL